MNKLFPLFSLTFFLFHLPWLTNAQTINISTPVTLNISASNVQAPSINYPTPQSYKINTVITPLAPQNTGGPIPPGAYGQVTTFAGNGTAGSDDGVGQTASFYAPSTLAIDGSGNIFVADYGNRLIRKITASGLVSTFAGKGTQGALDGIGSSAEFVNPLGIAIDGLGNLYVTEWSGNIIRKITPSGVVSTFAGSGTNGLNDGVGSSAAFYLPYGIATDAANNVYVADMQNSAIRKITPDGYVTTLAGTGFANRQNGPIRNARFYEPSFLTVDQTGNVFISENGYQDIREISVQGTVSSFATTSPRRVPSNFKYGGGLAFDRYGNLFMTDPFNHQIVEMSPDGVLTVIAGSGALGNLDGIANMATFNSPSGLAFDSSGNLFVADGGNNTIRKILLTGYTVDKPLPPGLTLDPATGVISGMPTIASPATNYIVTGYNEGGRSSTVVNIAVAGTVPNITVSGTSGAIYGCAGSASISPDLEKFTVSGTNLSDDVTITAPAGFELSLSASGSYGGFVTIPQNDGFANYSTIYVRSAASASAGTISGKVAITSQGLTSQHVSVIGLVGEVPTINQVADQVAKAGTVTTPITFAGTTSKISWVNNNSGIGLPANGTGNIPSFTATNPGTAPITATITCTAANTDGFVYTANSGSGSVSVINASTNVVVATIAVGSKPLSVAVSADGRRVYVANYNSNTISVINAALNSVMYTITQVNSPFCVKVSPDGKLIYVSNYDSNTVTVYDTDTYLKVNQLPVGPNPTNLCVSADGRYVYVIHSGGFDQIDIQTSTIPNSISSGGQYSGISLSPDGSQVYVTNSQDRFIWDINSSDETPLTTMWFAGIPFGVSVSPDGKKVYTSINDLGVVYALTFATNNNSIAAQIPVGTKPVSLFTSQNGDFVYVANQGSNSVSVINSATNNVVTTIPVGSNPNSVDGYIPITNCQAAPITFNFTVYQSVPEITASIVNGSIIACAGSASANPDIQQFAVTGNGLINNITASAPPGFEISLSSGSGYSNSLSLSQKGGIVDKTLIFVRSAATASAGASSDNVILSSAGATSVNVAVNGTINAIPTVNYVASQSIANGTATATINFTGTANTFNWVNDTPGIGLPASGSGNIAPFTVLNNTKLPVTATITVTPMLTGTTGSITCDGIPIIFSITVSPSLSPQIAYTGILSSLTTIYGTPSAATTFSISGINITAPILMAPPSGFELSTDNNNFSNSVTIGSAGTIVSAPVYLRLTSITPVGSYLGNIVLTSVGVTTVNIPVAVGLVNPAPLTVTANNVTKIYGSTLTSITNSGAFTSMGLKNNETIGSFNLTYGTGGAGADEVGTYTGSVIGSNALGGTFATTNYKITYIPGDIIVNKAKLTVNADYKTKLYGTPNPVLTATYTGFVNNDTPSQLTDIPQLNTTATATSPTGNYPITLSGGSSPDYSIKLVNGTLTIFSKITIPNTFTPNGDGVNDLWEIKSLSVYPQCTVSIFNRYGTLVYQSTGYPIPWDGTYQARPLPVGTYYYLISLQNGAEPIAGPVTILR